VKKIFFGKKIKIYLPVFILLPSIRVVKNYSTPIWSRVLTLLELLGTALLFSLYKVYETLISETGH